MIPSYVVVCIYLVRVQCSFRASPNGEKEGVLNQPTTGDVAFPLRPFTGEPVGARVGPTAYAVQQRRYLLNIKYFERRTDVFTAFARSASLPVKRCQQRRIDTKEDENEPYGKWVGGHPSRDQTACHRLGDPMKTKTAKGRERLSRRSPVVCIREGSTCIQYPLGTGWERKRIYS